MQNASTWRGAGNSFGWLSFVHSAFGASFVNMRARRIISSRLERSIYGYH